MKNAQHKKILFAGVAFFVVAALVMWIFSPRVSNKQSILMKHSHPYGLASKGGGQLEVAIVSDVSTPIPVATAFELTATVTATSELQDLQYEWILPKGVQLSSGKVSGLLGSLENGGSAEVTIQLLNSSVENKQVQLHVFRLVGGEPIGHMAQFNTSSQKLIADGLHAKVKALNAISTQSRKPASEHRRKIMQ